MPNIQLWPKDDTTSDEEFFHEEPTEDERCERKLDFETDWGHTPEQVEWAADGHEEEEDEDAGDGRHEGHQSEAKRIPSG